MAFNKAFYQSLPTKRTSTGAIFQNEALEYLLVKPNYLDHWQLAGGVVEQNESPSSCCKREVREELGLELHGYRLICIDYNSARPPATESVYFIFFGGILKPSHIGRIVLQEEELSSYGFFTVHEAQRLLNERMSIRLTYCVDAIEKGEIYYLENQKPV